MNVLFDFHAANGSVTTYIVPKCSHWTLSQLKAGVGNTGPGDGTAATGEFALWCYADGVALDTHVFPAARVLNVRVAE